MACKAFGVRITFRAAVWLLVIWAGENWQENPVGNPELQESFRGVVFPLAVTRKEADSAGKVPALRGITCNSNGGFATVHWSTITGETAGANKSFPVKLTVN